MDDRPHVLKRQRQARLRGRRKAGRAVALVEYDSDVVAFLARWGWLNGGEAYTGQEIASAISAALQDAARR
jgi:hypothetical protein